MKKSDFDLSFQNQQVESRIVAALERVAQAFRVLLWQESKIHTVSPIQIQLLIFLQHHSEEKCKVTYLADEFNMTKATISDTIKILEEKKLVKKNYTEADSRSYTIQLTQKGHDIATKTSFFTRELRLPIEKLAAEDKESLLLSLITIIKHLNEAEVITIQRMCLTCMHYQADRGKNHFCTLLNQKLKVTDLRIDCEEHTPAPAH